MDHPLGRRQVVGVDRMVLSVLLGGAVAIGSVAGTGDASPGCPTGRCGDIVLPVPRRDIGSERARGEWILLRSRCHVKRVLIREHSFNQPHMSKRSDDTAT